LGHFISHIPGPACVDLGLFAPKGTPADIIRTLNAAVVEALA
jgi:hypothetical protein